MLKPIEIKTTRNFRSIANFEQQIFVSSRKYDLLKFKESHILRKNNRYRYLFLREKIKKREIIEIDKLTTICQKNSFPSKD